MESRERFTSNAITVNTARPAQATTKISIKFTSVELVSLIPLRERGVLDVVTDADGIAVADKEFDEVVDKVVGTVVGRVFRERGTPDGTQFTLL